MSDSLSLRDPNSSFMSISAYTSGSHLATKFANLPKV